MAQPRRSRLAKHAIERMLQRNLTVPEMLAIVTHPASERPGNRGGRREAYGTTADGRAFCVVTDDARALVVSVAVLEES